MIEGLLCDLDGVLLVNDQPLPGALEAAQELKATLPLAFVTNSTRLTPKALAAKLVGLGLDISPKFILSPLSVAQSLLAERGIRRLWSLVAEGIQSAFDDYQQDQHHPEALVLGDIGPDWDYRCLNAAFNCLHQNPGIPVISLGLSTYYQGPQGLRLDVGPFARLLAEASGAELLVCGKPQQGIFALGAERLGLAPAQLAMVGDDLDTDVRAAQQAGLTGILVRTGKFRQQALDQGGKAPDVILDGLWALPAWLRAR
ncbi:HAD-IIA family hydrolase [Gallaecimonas xiamenensis]|uniref:HAD-superfamily hydrolase n=1 Tax=Gallaecimonas xiamenensis 3-C-1 TaxID=745411 RepID=K2JNV1_9GAMM|nr:HAD-IIA family hydrolase [Gallaecimonas xiamenensis]EKE76157.1 HAD-superfamily hydrolase [Gallaecimonas xiamenensis 3-C-1]